jgi:hypothetical protein
MSKSALTSKDSLQQQVYFYYILASGIHTHKINELSDKIHEVQRNVYHIK